ncbi:Type I inositol 1,4,5-trisphosphate 5-phosphatase CVP2 [Zostera marina]|uniref:Type I inositol 1,4,5-trisphosphate 5-phosphatase CVP2 n=1 Tax=Zostera marina TaxID=29655 RepID=A0A0K9NIN6_ZOSMR|nr:Type I inositol 1,4,5-trisphosphate 5-phosphatase CVP2 [Zostera marina]
MRDGNAKKTKLSWSKRLVRKWFNIKNKAHDFNADEDDAIRGGKNGDWRKDGFSETGREDEISSYKVKKSRTERSSSLSSRRCSGHVHRGKIDLDSSQVTDIRNYRIFAATWNVGGRSPLNHLNLEDWLHTSPPADIYVLGFQEIVPLNAGNVLGTEDNGPSRKWVALIRKTLNNLPGANNHNNSHQTPSPVPNPIVDLEEDFEGSIRNNRDSSFLNNNHRRSFQSSRSLRIDGDILGPSQPRLERRFSVCDRVMLGSRRPSDYDRMSYRWDGGSSDDDNTGVESPSCTYYSPMNHDHRPSSSLPVEEDRHRTSGRYCLVASKQMVGVFLMVWVRSEVKKDVRNMKVSCVGRGLMGYLGNKGSISISMQLHQTSFCFVCAHLSSGQKEGDELRRNSDVTEIIRKTRFPLVHGEERSPQTILEHDRVIWLGDLNYRIALSYRTAKALVEMHNWKALLENDQLRMEQRRGRVFEGWLEGRIYFPPTYKYSNNSDRYAGDDMHPKEKRRTPAWCDRILWYGRGLNQLSYVRGESRFSDHRPVYSIFKAEVESINHGRIRKNINSPPSSRIQVEELLPQSFGYTELNFF